MTPHVEMSRGPSSKMQNWTIERLEEYILKMHVQANNAQEKANTFTRLAEDCIFNREGYARLANNWQREVNSFRKRAIDYAAIIKTKKYAAVLQATHPRLGEHSPMRVLDTDVMARIWEMI